MKLFCLPPSHRKEAIDGNHTSAQAKLNYYLREKSRQFYLNTLITDETKDDQLSHPFLHKTFKDSFNRAPLAEFKYHYLDKEIFCVLAYGMHKVYEALHLDGSNTLLTIDPVFFPDISIRFNVMIIEAIHQYDGISQPIINLTKNEKSQDKITYTIQLNNPRYTLPLEGLYDKLMEFNRFMQCIANTPLPTDSLQPGEIELNLPTGLRKRK